MAYQKLLDKIMNVAPECSVAVSAVPYLLSEGCRGINSKIDRLNSALRQACSDHPLLYFWDVNPSAIWSHYKSDGVHFNYKGMISYSNFLVTKVKYLLNFPKLGTNPKT